MALGLTAVTVVALISRFFPGSFPQRGLPVLLPEGATRLAFPVGYWNALAILVALAIPLLLRIAVREGTSSSAASRSFRYRRSPQSST